MLVFEGRPFLAKDLAYAHGVASELPVLSKFQVPRITIASGGERGRHTDGHVRDDAATTVTIATETDGTLDTPPRRREVVRRRDLHPSLPPRTERRHLLNDALAERTLAEEHGATVVLERPREDLGSGC